MQKSFTVAILAMVITSIIVSANPALAHSVHIEIRVHGRGNVGAHFSRYDGPIMMAVDVHGIPMRIKTHGSTFTKIDSRDDSKNPPLNRITPGHDWVADLTVGGRGTFVLDISDWGNPGQLEIVLDIDGIQRFSAHGTGSNFDAWEAKNKYYGPGVRKTDDREISIDVGGD
jgi:hypothetical protein